MPELPEVEIIRRKLAPQIIDTSIVSIRFRRQDLRIPIPKDLKKRVVGYKIIDVRRRSKYLLVDFANDQTLIIHLGMSGRLFFTSSNRTYDKHDHVLFDLSNGKHLRFQDPRRFGILTVCETPDLDNHKLFSHLGLEPLSDEFTGKRLYLICKRSTSPIKNFIMNAKYVVGVGNIYANEALFLSQIRPSRRGFRVTKTEAYQLCANIKRVLAESIEMGGTSFRDYVDPYEQPGLHQLHLRVYDRENQPCRACQMPIKRIVQSNRSSYYCMNCQK